MALTSLLDTLLDRAIVPGYSRVGYVLRRSWWAADSEPGALTGHTVAITGANAGLGKATAVGAARLGASVRLLCRDLDRGRQARDDILGQCAGADVVVDECDLSNLKSVRAAASRLRDELPAIHALVHNACVIPPERTETPD